MWHSTTLLIFIFAISYTRRVCGLALGNQIRPHHHPRSHHHRNFSSIFSKNHPFPEFPPFPAFPAFHTHPALHLPQLSQEQLHFAQEGLILHNKYRERHGAPPLTLDLQLIHDAYEWAKKDVAECSAANRFVLTHSHRRDRGENIYAEQGTSHMTARAAVENWYNEVGLYNWKKPGFQSIFSHFSQVVWKNTKTMGMAMAKGANGFMLTVAQYQPPGNIIDNNQFASNVLPART